MVVCYPLKKILNRKTRKQCSGRKTIVSRQSGKAVVGDKRQESTEYTVE